MVSEVVVFALLYSMCCSIIEDQVCVFGVCCCCGISVCLNTEKLHASLFFFESADDFNNPLFKWADVLNAFNAFKQQQQAGEWRCCPLSLYPMFCLNMEMILINLCNLVPEFLQLQKVSGLRSKASTLHGPA